ncbi:MULTISPECIES: TIGR03757 family integrating conjugative element protein [Entomomonas]|uniref:TIGR03757 family integrating conjugative element protein n=1 Tax=Entomomonas asaccharolytica TaxID=2785331 RepID=A0A974NHW9_9GAMM|nr:MULTISPECIES: TIGR03757 family integrating conjugative element protein [Entomomonas]QQP86858.1 TIGR03757 family integrating conjugative element protein [Entomomonas asaccharolytica]UYZ83524.1 TIGR03757 family integrating conjugative element protein [Entomomonas sp. E2T0]
MSILTKPIALFMLLVVGVLSTATGNAEVLIFTDQKHPVYNVGNYKVIYLDEPSNIEQILSEGLSNKPEEAKLQATERISNPTLQKSLIESYLQVAKAWQLGITKVPAVVSENYVVYGQADVSQALVLINDYQVRN